MLTAAAGEASGADARVAAALGIVALAPILQQSSPRHQAKETTTFPLPLPRWGKPGQPGSGMGRGTWQGRSWQVGQWEMPCVVRLTSWKTISSPWMRSSRTQPGMGGGVGGGGMSIWRGWEADQQQSASMVPPFSSWGSITSQESSAGEVGTRKVHSPTKPLLSPALGMAP